MIDPLVSTVIDIGIDEGAEEDEDDAAAAAADIINDLRLNIKQNRVLISAGTKISTLIIGMTRSSILQLLRHRAARFPPVE